MKSCQESRHSLRQSPTRLRPSLRSGLALLVVLLATGGCGNRSSEQIFLDSVATPCPSSVNILHAEESGGLSHQSWLHFRIAPKDFAALVKADGFVPLAADEIPFDFTALRPPRWWQFSTLGSGLKCYVLEDKVHEQSRLRKILFANEDEHEVFFLQFY